MSLQANWNSAIRTLGVLGKINDVEKKVGDKRKPYEKPELNIGEITPESVAEIRRQQFAEGQQVHGGGDFEMETMENIEDKPSATQEETFDRVLDARMTEYVDEAYKDEFNPREEQIARLTEAKTALRGGNPNRAARQVLGEMHEYEAEQARLAQEAILREFDQPRYNMEQARTNLANMGFEFPNERFGGGVRR